MIPLRSIPFAILLAATVPAQSVKISLGIRETQAGGGAFTAIGANGGSLGGIEFVARDVQPLVLDGTWQLFTFNLTTDPLTAFAGLTANSILDGTYGVVENVRVLNDTGIVAPITLWIDDLENSTTIQPTVTIGDNEGFATGAEVVFQEPSFSGSTSANLVLGSTNGVSNRVAARTSSMRFDFQFIDGTPTRWVRLTTFNTPNLPNPLIRFDNQAVVSFWMRGGVAQQDLGSQGPGPAIAEIVGTGLGAGQASVYYTAGAPASGLGVRAVSWFGFPDVPLFGGNVVSGAGLILTDVIFADPNGRTQLLLLPFGVPYDLVLQTAYFDATLVDGFAFTNAVRATFP